MQNPESLFPIALYSAHRAARPCSKANLIFSISDSSSTSILVSRRHLFNPLCIGLSCGLPVAAVDIAATAAARLVRRIPHPVVSRSGIHDCRVQPATPCGGPLQLSAAGGGEPCHLSLVESFTDGIFY
eukprot:gene838-biopygen6720